MDGLFNVSDAVSNDIENAVVAAFEDLETKGLVGPIERAKRAALVKAAAALDRGMAAHKMSVATSTVLKQVLESLDTLPREQESGDEAFDAFELSIQNLTIQAFKEAESE